MMDDPLYEVMPQHACRVLQHADKDADDSGLVLDSWAGVAILYAEQLAQLAEARETPVAFFGDEAMVRVYWRQLSEARH